VLWGGVIIAAGHYTLAVPTLPAFYLGLALIVVGTGLLKPNISTMVGALYPEHDARRDAGFSIFYMGINLGAMLAPLVCGYLGENINWHYGFGAAGVGMTLGLIQYVHGGKYLGTAGLESRGSEADRRIFRRALILSPIVIGLVVAGVRSGRVSVSAESISNMFGIALIGIVVVFFVWLLTAKGYSAQ
jgi:POT family proton-dependent oligopeptide transporter